MQANNQCTLCSDLAELGLWWTQVNILRFIVCNLLQCLPDSWTHLHGNSERKVSVQKSDSLPGWLMMETEALSPHKVARRGQALVLYSDLRLQKQQLSLVHFQVVQAQGCSRGGYFSSLCLVIRYISLLLQWYVNTWIPWGTLSGQKVSFFFPRNSVSRIQVISQMNSVINPFPSSLFLSRSLNS